MCAAKVKKTGDEGGEHWCCSLIENSTRLRASRGVGHSEGEAAQQVWRYWRWTLGHEQPPPLVSDGWGGHHDALLEVFGKRHGSRRSPRRAWHYLQMVKIRDDYKRVIGLRPRLVWATPAETTLSPTCGLCRAYPSDQSADASASGAQNLTLLQTGVELVGCLILGRCGLQSHSSTQDFPPTHSPARSPLDTAFPRYGGWIDGPFVVG